MVVTDSAKLAVANNTDLEAAAEDGFEVLRARSDDRFVDFELNTLAFDGEVAVIARFQ